MSKKEKMKLFSYVQSIQISLKLEGSEKHKKYEIESQIEKTTSRGNY